MMNIISIIEGDAFGSAARQRLCERHWSNILAWLLSEQFAGKEISSKMLSVLLKLSGIELRGNRRIVKVEREIRVGHKENSRIIDVLVTFEEGWKLHIENKIDRDYEDVSQLHGEIEALSEDDHLILLCPRGLSLLSLETKTLLKSVPNFHHVRWLDYSNEIAVIENTSQKVCVPLLFFKSIVNYWSDREKEDFLWQAERIIEEKEWSRFYPDEFKEEFCVKFKSIYKKWVDEKGSHGRGNAHQYLTQRLAGLVTRKRLRETGNRRSPKDKNWGWPFVYEYEVVGATDEAKGVS